MLPRSGEASLIHYIEFLVPTGGGHYTKNSVCKDYSAIPFGDCFMPFLSFIDSKNLNLTTTLHLHKNTVSVLLTCSHLSLFSFLFRK